MKDLDRLFNFDPARHEKKSSVRDQRLMQGCEFGGAENRGLRHEMFLEEIGMVDHRPLERLKNHAALLQIFGNDIALDQLIVRENQTRRELVEAARVFENIFAIVIRQCPAEFERRQIEKVDIGKAPELIFAGW